MNTRLMVRSIALAVGLTFCLGVLFAAALLLSGQIDLSQIGGDGDGGDKNKPCTFTSATAMLAVYQAPLTDATQQKARLDGSAPFPVLQQRSQHVLLELRDTRTAWADQRDGTLAGQCSSVPVDNTPLEGFPTLCIFRTLGNVPLYGNAALTSFVGTLPPGTYPLIGFNRDRYYVYLDTNRGGWVLGSAGQLSGNCVMLPARPG